MKEITLPVEQLRDFVRRVLLKANVREDVADYVTEGLIQTSVRGVDSHGVRLLPHYLRGVQGGRINPNPNYQFKRTSPSTGILDADHTFGHAAGMEAVKKAVALAKEAGTGQVAVYNSSHFGAAAYYALEIARQDMIGMSFTNTDALIRSYAGSRAFLGNNPVCFAAPCKDEEPFCLDMATSVWTFNKVRQFAEQGLPVPEGVGADSQGRETTDAKKMTMLLPMGGYKGYGLSMMVEILCSLLSGMPYGPHIPKMFEAGMDKKRYLGHFVSALRIDCFQDTELFKNRLSGMMKELRSEPAANDGVAVKVAGDPEKICAASRTKRGIPLKPTEYEALKKAGEGYGVIL